MMSMGGGGFSMGMGRGGRGGPCGCGCLALILVVMGAVFLLLGKSGLANAKQYEAAPVCASGQSAGANCITTVQTTILASNIATQTHYNSTSHGGQTETTTQTTTVTFASSSGLPQAQFNSAEDFSTGSAATVREWQGQVVSFAVGGQDYQTDAYPSQGGGIAGMVVGGVMILVALIGGGYAVVGSIMGMGGSRGMAGGVL